MKYLVVLIFIIVYLFFPGDGLGYTCTSPFYTHFSYMFQHQGVMHLAINSMSFIGISRLAGRMVNKWLLAMLSFGGGFVLSFFTAGQLPTVGASGVIYIMTGLYAGMTAFDERVRITDAKRHAASLVMITVALAVSSLVKTSNYSLHSLWFLSGVFMSVFYQLIKTIYSYGREIFNRRI